MSGTFENISVPPTLVSFAASVVKASSLISPEFKKAGSNVSILEIKCLPDGTFDKDDLNEKLDMLSRLIKEKKVISAWVCGHGGVLEGIFKMAIGNSIGFEYDSSVPMSRLGHPFDGTIILELSGSESIGTHLGVTSGDPVLRYGESSVSLEELIGIYDSKLENVFPMKAQAASEKAENISYAASSYPRPKVACKKPRVLIPVFPGTNCEYDTARAFERAGAEPEIYVINNLSSSAIENSVADVERIIKSSQIIALPGGFSGGDEPDGSGKFITAFFKNPSLRSAVNELIKSRDGLMLGICNGFQALIKLGLVPFGEIIDTDENCPTLTYNVIARHQSRQVMTRVASNKSPWLIHTKPGDVYSVPVSHGEGRFVATDEVLKKLIENGQIATQYCDFDGNASMDIRFNPNGSVCAVEGILSPDGRVFGKMGHVERMYEDLYVNYPLKRESGIFSSAVDYYSI